MPLRNGLRVWESFTAADLNDLLPISSEMGRDKECRGPIIFIVAYNIGLRSILE